MHFIGMIEATITSPSGVTERAERDLYARAFLDALEEKLSRRGGDKYSIEFRLLTTESGCIIVKAAIVLVGAAIASMTVSEFTDASKYGNHLRAAFDTWFECKVNRTEWACKLQKLDFDLTSKFYKTEEGDTLESVLNDKFNVSDADMAATLKVTEEWYSHALIDKTSKRLKPGHFIGHLAPDMPLPPKSLQTGKLN